MLTLGDTAYTPGGLIAVVTAVTTSGGSTTVTYTQGSLLDAFEQLNLTSQIPATQAASLPELRHRLQGSGIPGPSASVGTLSLSKSVVLGKDPSVSASLTLSFSPSISFSVAINTATILHIPDGISVHYAVDETSSVSASFTFGGSWSGSQTVPFGDVELGAFDIGPIWVTPELSAHLILAAAASASVSLSSSISEAAHVGFTMAASTTHPFSYRGDPDNGFGTPQTSGFSAPAVSLSASASATLEFQFSLNVDSIAGPDAQGDAEIEFDVNPASTPWWALKAEGGIGIGVNLNALGIPLLGTVLNDLHVPTNPTWKLGQLGPWTLASATGPSPGPTGGSGSGSGGSGNPLPGSNGNGSGPGTVGGSSVGPVPAGSSAETTGGPTGTFADYSDAGDQGPSIAGNTTVGVACRIQGFAVADGNTWWYQISSSPWSSDYYASADAFYNNGETSGSLQGTPFYDPAVPLCRGQSGGTTGSGGLSGTVETTGSVTSTWTDYSDAGGAQGPAINSNTQVQVVCRLQGFAVADGNTWWYQIGSDPWNGNFYASADAFYNNGATSGSLLGTPFVDTAVPVCGAPPSQPQTVAETTGGLTHTWTDYSDAGGTEGPSIASNETVQIYCAVQGFAVADGNTWWYQVASSPWSGTYYASADAFYNNGATTGSLIGTPFVDPAVPQCKPPVTTLPSSYAETTGSVVHTWTDYSDAGGTEGQEIGSNVTVQITCALTGFKVADGNTWWYQIASSPWNNDYYASADAFYNNGQTSGPLAGTPFVDPAVPLCPQQTSSGTGTPETTGSVTHTWTDYSDAGGTQGPSISSNATVDVACRIQGFAVADGNTWWYQISSSPWNDTYYASADAFYNNGQTSGSLQGTPFYDPNVPVCS